jgi:hypothetical protein
LPEEIELRRDDLLNPRSYAVQLAGRDVALEPEDFDAAMFTLGTAPRGEYEQVWPSLDVTIAAVLEAHRLRTADERHEAGANFMERTLQAAQREREEQDRIWRERKVEREAKAAAEQAVVKPTQAPPESTTEPRGSLRDMRPEYVDSVITILNELEKMATNDTCGDYEIALGLLRTVNERNTVATARGVLRLYWPDAGAERKAAEAEASKPQ